MTEIIDELTPIEYREGYYFKRDDFFSVAGVCGGKARTCWALAQSAKRGLVTAGSRFSPQCKIVAYIARARGLPCHIHTTEGELGPELEAAISAGAHIYQHKPGYNSVIIKRAKEDAARMDFFHRTRIVPYLYVVEKSDYEKKEGHHLIWSRSLIILEMGEYYDTKGKELRRVYNIKSFNKIYFEKKDR